MNPSSIILPSGRDHFLSEEDLDLANLSTEELEAWWNAWLEAAQVTNEDDQYDYSHGVFRRAPVVLPSQKS
jgi:hypothetical protein